MIGAYPGRARILKLSSLACSCASRRDWGGQGKSAGLNGLGFQYPGPAKIFET